MLAVGFRISAGSLAHYAPWTMSKPYFVADEKGIVLGEYDDVVTAKRALDASVHGKAMFRRRDGAMLSCRSATAPGDKTFAVYTFAKSRCR